MIFFAFKEIVDAVFLRVCIYLGESSGDKKFSGWDEDHCWLMTIQYLVFAFLLDKSRRNVFVESLPGVVWVSWLLCCWNLSLLVCTDIFLVFCLNAIPSAVLKEAEQPLSAEDPWSWLDTEMIVSMTFRDEF